MTARKHLETQSTGKICVIRMSGVNLFDPRGLGEFEQTLMRVIDTEQPAELVLDFAGVPCCSARMIGDLVKTKRQLSKTSVRLRLNGMSETLRGFFRLLNLDGTVFDIGDEPADTTQREPSTKHAGVKRQGRS